MRRMEMFLPRISEGSLYPTDSSGDSHFKNVLLCHFRAMVSRVAVGTLLTLSLSLPKS